MKILILRFSSIGDIILTTPILRALKSQIDGVEIHYCTKKQFAFLLENNPNCNRVFSFNNELHEVWDNLKKEKYDWVIDLHNNIRSLRLKWKLGFPSRSFSKLNIQKWLLVYFKWNRLPKMHIVERYYQTVSHLGVVPDDKGLDYFIPQADEINIQELPGKMPLGYHAVVVGGSYLTKRIPIVKLEEICSLSYLPLVLLGGKEDEAVALVLSKKFPEKVLNVCGKLNFNQSASLIQQANKVISSDTGLMHVAAAFNKPVFSIWGNTVPEFGMTPYQAAEGSKIIEVKNLSCRPCSKLGYSDCPKRHFDCMLKADVTVIFEKIS